MRKILTCLAVAGLISSSVAFAATANSSTGYYSNQHPKTQGAMKADAKASKHYPMTDITVWNLSYDYIYATVPGTIVYDQIMPNGTDHIYNDYPIAWTHLRILDPYQNPIFDGDVCKRAFVTITGGPGSYRTNVNSSGC